MWLQHVKAQKGSATLLALLAVLILGASTGIYIMSSGAGIKNGDEISAQYAAEAGVTYALAHAKQNTVITTGYWNMGTLATDPVALDSTNVNSPTFTITLTQISSNITLNDSTGTLKCAYYKITSLGKFASTTRSVDAYLTIPLPPTPISTFELMKDADFSSSKWTINTDDPKNPFASAPADQYYQVLFKDKIDANKGFTLNYNVNLADTNSSNPNDTGYGIYYLANGNADNMTAYVLQYDPGLTPDQILVKKVIASKKSTTQPWLNEIHLKDWYGNQISDSFQKSTSTSPKWGPLVTHPSITNPDGTVIPETKTMSINNLDPTTMANQDLMTIKMSDVLQQLDSSKINGNIRNTMKGQNHRLSINAHSKNGNIVHTISIDGLEILKFVDRGTPYTAGGVPLTTGSTGLRVWEATAHFFNNTNDFAGAIGSIKIRSWNKRNDN